MRWRGPRPAALRWTAGYPANPASHTTRRYQAPAQSASFPALPASRGHPQVVPVSNGENISTAFLAVTQESAAIHFEFFPVHTISTEPKRLSAGCSGYPPTYAQLIHKLLNVIQRVLAQRWLNVISWFPGDCRQPFSVSGETRWPDGARGASGRLVVPRSLARSAPADCGATSSRCVPAG